jgi:hypothetical protein
MLGTSAATGGRIGGTGAGGGMAASAAKPLRPAAGDSAVPTANGTN